MVEGAEGVGEVLEGEGLVECDVFGVGGVGRYVPWCCKESAYVHKLVYYLRMAKQLCEIHSIHAAIARVGHLHDHSDNIPPVLVRWCAGSGSGTGIRWRREQ